jgi:hypothetical protein
MKLEDNPILKQEDYNSGYKDKIEELKNQPHLVELDKLCYELFYINEIGKKFMEIVETRYLIPPMADRNSPNFSINAVWAEGFKDAFRMLKQFVESHKQRIKAEMK